MDEPPAGGETIGDVDDAPEVVRPPALDDRLEHAAEEAVVLAEGLDEAVGAGEVPRGQQVRAGSTHVPHANVAHDTGKVQVGVGDGPRLALDGERSLSDAHAPAVLAHEVRLVRQHVEGEGPQALREEPDAILEGRDALGERQVEKGARRGDEERGDG